jgi:hypothetical protein
LACPLWVFEELLVRDGRCMDDIFLDGATSIVSSEVKIYSSPLNIMTKAPHCPARSS